MLAAHSLKGAASMIGADSLSEAAAKVEVLGKNGHLDDVPDRMAAVRDAFSKTKQQLQRAS
jgi:HPt (histidine-containing phosphotransfer) domain-containing protein